MDTNNIEISADAQEENKTVEAVKPDTEAELAELRNKLAKTEEILTKARKGEKDNQTRRKDLEAELAQIKADEEGNDFKSKYEAANTELGQLKDALKTQLIDGALREELAKANTKSISTVMKIVDRTKINVVDGKVDTKTIEAVIEELRKTDAVLFDVPKTPDIKRPGESAVTAGFKTEMAAAKTPQQLKAVLAKYGMGSTN